MEKQHNFLNSLTGPVSIPMTNDYLFRALLQRNTKVLRGLLCSLLHMKDDEIISVTITNPIVLGDAFDEKEFFLDINLVLNNHTRINLEMQVVNEHNWQERSLSYLCRNFDNLNKGNEYKEVKAAIQIALLDFTLFSNHPEFYAKYQLLNVHNFTKYSDKFSMNVLDLTQIELATDEDKAYRIDYWAALFKATTWEEIRMLAEKDENIRDASVTIAQLTQEERIRLQCEAREDYNRRQRYINARLAELEVKEATLAEMDKKLQEKDVELQEKDVELQEKDAELQEKDVELQEKDAELQEKNVELREKDAELQEKNVELREKDTELREKDTKLEEQEAKIKEKDAMINALKARMESIGISAEES